MSRRSRKWNLSSCDDVAVNIRTGTDTRPNEITPLQIGRATSRCLSTAAPRKTGVSGSPRGAPVPTTFLHLTGGQGARGPRSAGLGVFTFPQQTEPAVEKPVDTGENRCQFGNSAFSAVAKTPIRRNFARRA